MSKKVQQYFIDLLPEVKDVQYEFSRRGIDRKARNYVIYCRESDEDRDSTQSIPAQEELCVRLAESQELNVLQVVREKKSARHDNRPAFGNLIRAIKGDEALIGLTAAQRKLGRPDGIIAWHPDRLSRNMRDGGEIIELLDDEMILDMRFVAYSFHNDSSGKEHLAMEFARAKGYSDLLEDNVLRGTMRQELMGKKTKHLPPAYDFIRGNKRDHDHLKIIASQLHRFWRMAYAWKLEGKTDVQVAQLLKDNGYQAWREYRDKHGKKRKEQVRVNKDYVGRHLDNPIHCGLLIPETSDQLRKVDLNEVYRNRYNEEFPVCVTLDEFKFLYPNKFSDTASGLSRPGRRTDRPLSGKVLCKTQLEADNLATMSYAPSKGGTKKPAHRFFCSRCKYHSINIKDVFDAVEGKIKEVKISEREHKKFVITHWSQYEAERQQFLYSKRQIQSLKASNDDDIEFQRSILRGMEYGPKPASDDEINSQKLDLQRLEREAVDLIEREKNLVEESIEQYYDTEAFLKLAKDGYLLWKKADENKKRDLGDLLVLNVIVEGGKVALVTLNEPFEGWSKDLKEKKIDDGGQYWT